MRAAPRRTEGFTLIEVLVAMAILTVILAVVLSTSLEALSMQTRTERDVNLDAGLRRVTQILTQDIRNTAYGLVTSTPYTSTASSISLVRAEGGAVHPVTVGSGVFKNATNTTLITPLSFKWAKDTRFVLLNAVGGTATVLTLSSAVTGSTGSAVLPHTDVNTVCYAEGSTLAQPVQVIGYSYDAPSQTLLRQVQDDLGTRTVPLAYGVSAFSLAYIDTSGTSHTTLAGLSNPNDLARISVSVTLRANARGGVVTRTVSSGADMPRMFTESQRPLRYLPPGTAQTCL